METSCLKRLERSSKTPCGLEGSYREAGGTYSHSPKPDPEARSPDSSLWSACLELSTARPSKEMKFLECLVPQVLLVWLLIRSGFNENGYGELLSEICIPGRLSKIATFRETSNPPEDTLHPGPDGLSALRFLVPSRSLCTSQIRLPTLRSFLSLHTPLCPAWDAFCPLHHVSNSYPALKSSSSPTPSSSSGTHYLL